MVVDVVAMERAITDCRGYLKIIQTWSSIGACSFIDRNYWKRCTRDQCSTQLPLWKALDFNIQIEEDVVLAKDLYKIVV